MMIKTIWIILVSILIFVSGCKSIHSPLMSKEEKFKIALEEYLHNQDWRIRNENLTFLFKDTKDAELLYSTVKEKSDFRELDIFAAETMKRWNDTTLLSYLIQKVDEGKIEINAKSSACRELIQRFSRNYYFELPTSASSIVTPEKWKLYIKFAELTDKHFFGINRSYLSNKYELTPQLLLNKAQRALREDNGKLFEKVISDIKQHYFNSEIEKSANFGIRSPYHGIYISGAITVSALIRDFAQNERKSCAGICSACLEASYWMKSNKSEKALKVLIQAYNRAKRENLTVDAMSIKKALIEYIKKYRDDYLPSVNSPIYLREFAFMSPDFRILCMIVYLENKLGNKKEWEKWSQVLDDKWGVAVKEALFPESYYNIQKQ